MALVFIESGSDANGGIEFYDQSVGNVPTSSLTVAKTGTRSIRFQGNGPSYLVKLNTMVDAGRRIQGHFRFTALPVNSFVPLIAVVADNSEVYSVRLNANGKVCLFANGVLVFTGTTTITVNTWFKIALSFAITSSTVNSAKVWVDATLEGTGTNVTLGATGSNHLYLGWISDPGRTAADFMYVDNIYVDDITAVTNPGEIFVTCKKPAAVGAANAFDTVLGGAPTNRWDHVDDVPLNIATGYQQAGGTAVSENFQLQAIAVGEVDLTAATIIGRTAWVYAKRGTVDGVFVQKCAQDSDETVNTSLNIKNAGLATVAGNTIVVGFVMNNDANNEGGIVTCTDSAGNSYTLAAQKSTGGTPGSKVRTLLFYAQNANSVPPGGSWTLNYPAVEAKAVMVIELAGISASPIDVTKTNADTTSAPSTGATSVTSQAAVIMVGAIGFANTPFEFKAVGTGMTPQQQHIDVVGTNGAKVNVSLEMQYTVQTAVNAHTAACTLNSINPVSAVIAGFKSNGTTLGDPKITDNGSSTTSIVLNVTPTLHTLITTSATYPSNAAGVGIVSGGATPDTFLYDCGTIIAYS